MLDTSKGKIRWSLLGGGEMGRYKKTLCYKEIIGKNEVL